MERTEIRWEKEEEYRGLLAGYDIFDSNLWWDPRREGFRACADMDGYRRELAKAHIASGIVTSVESAQYDPYYGNERLAELLKDEKGFYGCMVLTPEMMPGDGEAYVDGLLERNFAAARMFPGFYYHSMKPYCAGAVLKLLERKRIPLMLWHSQVPWDMLDELCETYPRLPVIVEGHDVKLLYHSRNYLKLLEKHANFYVETHNLVLFDEIRTLVEKTGAGNLLFGSYFPYHTPHHALYSIAGGELDEAAKQKILGANLLELVGAIRK